MHNARTEGDASPYQDARAHDTDDVRDVDGTARAGGSGHAEGGGREDRSAEGGAGTPGPRGGPAGQRDAPELLDLERELTVFLRRARAASAVLAREVHPDLEPAAYGLLVRLEDAGPQRATELAAYFGVGKATISRQLQALVALGIVERTRDPADGRASLVELTPVGRTRFSRVRRARRAEYRRKLAAWDRAEIAELARLLHQFNALGGAED